MRPVTVRHWHRISPGAQTLPSSPPKNTPNSALSQTARSLYSPAKTHSRSDSSTPCRPLPPPQQSGNRPPIRRQRPPKPAAKSPIARPPGRRPGRMRLEYHLSTAFLDQLQPEKQGPWPQNRQTCPGGAAGRTYSKPTATESARPPTNDAADRTERSDVRFATLGAGGLLAANVVRRPKVGERTSPLVRREDGGWHATPLTMQPFLYPQSVPSR